MPLKLISLFIFLLFLIQQYFIIYFILILLVKNKIHYRYRWIAGVLINLFILLGGYELTILKTPKFNTQNISNITSTPSLFLIQVTEPISERQHSFKIVAKSIEFKDSLQWKSCSGKLILYFEKDSLVKFIEYGDQIIDSF